MNEHTSKSLKSSEQWRIKSSKLDYSTYTYKIFSKQTFPYAKILFSEIVDEPKINTLLLKII